MQRSTRSALSVIEEVMHPKDAEALVDALDRAGYVIVRKEPMVRERRPLVFRDDD